MLWPTEFLCCRVPIRVSHQTGRWVLVGPVKASRCCLIEDCLFTGLSPRDRLIWGLLGLDRVGSARHWKQLGVRWMDLDSLSLSETSSESQGVNLTRCQVGLGQSTAQSHRGERPYWAERLELKPSFAAAERTRPRCGSNTSCIWTAHTCFCWTCRKKTINYLPQFIPNKTLSCAKCGTKNEGIRDTSKPNWIIIGECHLDTGKENQSPVDLY